MYRPDQCPMGDFPKFGKYLLELQGNIKTFSARVASQFDRRYEPIHKEEGLPG